MKKVHSALSLFRHEYNDIMIVMSWLPQERKINNGNFLLDMIVNMSRFFPAFVGDMVPVRVIKSAIWKACKVIAKE